MHINLLKPKRDMKNFILVFLFLMYIISCSKSNPSPSMSLIGTWTFRSQISGTFPYPYPYPTFSWAYAGNLSESSTDNDTFSLKFDNLGNFFETIPGGYYFVNNTET